MVDAAIIEEDMISKIYENSSAYVAPSVGGQ